MKCVMCGRSMFKPAVSVGRMNLGPKCAVRAGFIEPPRPKGYPLFSRLLVKRDKRTADMFEVAA